MSHEEKYEQRNTQYGRLAGRLRDYCDGSCHSAHIAAAEIGTMNIAVIIECPGLGKREIEMERRRVIPGISGETLSHGGSRAVKTLIPNPSNGVADINHGVHHRFSFGIEAKIKVVHMNDDLCLGGSDQSDCEDRLDQSSRPIPQDVFPIGHRRNRECIHGLLEF